MSTTTLSPLRQRMIEDMSLRNLAPRTQEAYIRGCKKLAAFLRRSSDTATAEDIRLFQLHLAEQGSLDLDAPVWRYCPDFPEKPWPVTARQLLCHQGGVRHYRPDEPTETRRFESFGEALARFRDDPLVHEPGTGVRYSTYGYNLLGCAGAGAA